MTIEEKFNDFGVYIETDVDAKCDFCFEDIKSYATFFDNSADEYNKIRVCVRCLQIPRFLSDDKINEKEKVK